MNGVSSSDPFQNKTPDFRLSNLNRNQNITTPTTSMRSSDQFERRPVASVWTKIWVANPIRPGGAFKVTDEADDERAAEGARPCILAGDVEIGRRLRMRNRTCARNSFLHSPHSTPRAPHTAKCDSHATIMNEKMQGWARGGVGRVGEGRGGEGGREFRSRATRIKEIRSRRTCGFVDNRQSAIGD